MCDTPQSIKQSFLFVEVTGMWTASASPSLLCIQTGAILQFSVAVDEILSSKASSLRLNVRPHDSQGRRCRLTCLATVNAGTIKHKVPQGTTIWEQMSGPRRVIRLILHQVRPKIIKAVNVEGSPCTSFLQHSKLPLQAQLVAQQHFFKCLQSWLSWKHSLRCCFSDLSA